MVVLKSSQKVCPSSKLTGSKGLRKVLLISCVLRKFNFSFVKLVWFSTSNSCMQKKSFLGPTKLIQASMAEGGLLSGLSMINGTFLLQDLLPNPQIRPKFRFTLLSSRSAAQITLLIIKSCEFESCRLLGSILFFILQRSVFNWASLRGLSLLLLCKLFQNGHLPVLPRAQNTLNVMRSILTFGFRNPRVKGIPEFSAHPRGLADSRHSRGPAGHTQARSRFLLRVFDARRGVGQHPDDLLHSDADQFIQPGCSDRSEAERDLILIKFILENYFLLRSYRF